jgi:hypothetical protein
MSCLLILLLATISAMRSLLNFSFSMMVYILPAEGMAGTDGILAAIDGLDWAYLLISGCLGAYLGIFFRSILNNNEYNALTIYLPYFIYKLSLDK